MLWAEMNDFPLPEALPAEWLGKWQGEAPVALPTTFLDPKDAFPPIPRRREIEEKNAITIRRALHGTPFLF
jgi:acetoin utilization protein AcuC